MRWDGDVGSTEVASDIGRLVQRRTSAFPIDAIPIITSGGLRGTTVLKTALHKRGKTMKILDTIDEDEAVHRIAETAHEVNRAYCRSIGEEDQPSWKDAEAWRRESCINGVWAIVAHPDTTPEQSHNNWVNQKLQDGWAWGPSKDPEKKEHPCMVPYSQLPEEQKVKDALFTAVVKSLI